MDALVPNLRHDMHDVSAGLQLPFTGTVHRADSCSTVLSGLFGEAVRPKRTCVVFFHDIKWMQLHNFIVF